MSTRTLDDIGNKNRFLDEFGKSVAYCPPLERWIHWNGKVWRFNENMNVIQFAERITDMMRDEAKAILKDENAEPEARAFAVKLAEHAGSSRSYTKLKAMVNLASHDDRYFVEPSDFDKNPMILNLQNGVLDLETGKLHPHARDFYCTKISPIWYDAKATCPEFDRFLLRAMTPDSEYGWTTSTTLDMINYIWRAMGYTITGLTGERVFFVCHGSGQNGKSKLLDVLEAMLGLEVFANRLKSASLCMTGQASGGSSHDTDIADIEGCRAILSDEIPENAVLNEALVKALTGDSTIKARQIHQKGRPFRPVGKLWLAVNHLPKITGQDPAIWGRVHQIPFLVRIPDHEKDVNLFKRIIANELPGVLNYCLAGLQDFLKTGLQPPDPVTKAVEAYREAEDVLGRFLQDCCLIGESYSVSNADLYATYNQWAKLSGYKPVAENRLGRMFSERGFERTASNGVRGWMGLGLPSRDDYEREEQQLMYPA